MPHTTVQITSCMDRPKRAAAMKITDFRHYHLSGDLNTELAGRVDTHISQFESTMSTEELRKQLEEDREAGRKVQEDMECMKIQNEIETERLKRQQWEAAREQLKQAQEVALQEHEKCMSEIKRIAEQTRADTAAGAAEWLKEQVAQIGSTGKTPEEVEREKKEKLRLEAITELEKQQANISQQLAELKGDTTTEGSTTLDMVKEALSQGGGNKASQEVILQQLKATLTGKKEEDPKKALLKAFITTQNKTPEEGGTNTPP